MNDLESLQLKQVELLIQDGMGRAENHLQSFNNMDDVQQLLQEIQEHQAKLKATNEQAELLSVQSLALEPKLELAQSNVDSLENKYQLIAAHADTLEQQSQAITTQFRTLEANIQASTNRLETASSQQWETASPQEVLHEVSQLNALLQKLQTDCLANQDLIHKAQIDIINLSQTYGTNHSALQNLLFEQEQQIKSLETLYSDQTLQQVQVDIANLSQTYVANHSALQEVLAGHERYIKRLEAQHSEQNTQQVEADLASLSQTHEVHQRALQDALSTHEHHIKRLEAKRSEQVHQISTLAAQLENFNPLDNPNQSLDTLRQDVEQLELQIETIANNIPKAAYINEQRLTQKYQILVVVSAIAAAGLTLLGQGLFNLNQPQPAPPSQPVSLLTSHSA